jgi:hypothetical protein
MLATLICGFTDIDFDYIVYPAAGASIVSLIVVSLLTKPSPEEKWKPFMSR